MKPLHCIIGLCVALLLFLGLVAGPLALVAMLLLSVIIGAVIYVHAMNRQQQEEARQVQPRQGPAGLPGGGSSGSDVI